LTKKIKKHRNIKILKDVQIKKEINMKSKKAIQEYLKELEQDLKKDEEAEVDDKLPCCDFRELEVSVDMLKWVLK